MEEENLAFEELSKLSVNDASAGAAESSVEASLKKENFNVVFVGHVGKIITYY